MIVTVTPASAIDWTVEVKSFGLGAVNRARRSSREPGGKGLNISWALHRARRRTRAVFPAGGSSGQFMAQALTRAGMDHVVVDTGVDVRVNITLITPGASTKVDDAAGALSAPHVAQLRDAVLAAGRDGAPLAMGRATTPWSTVTVDGTTGQELDADALVAAARIALDQALSDVPAGRVIAVGVTSMAESGVPLDGHGADVGLQRLTGAVLTTAGHDHQAAALGADAADAGSQLDSCGTAEALVRTVAAGFSPRDVADLTRDGITVGWHVLPDRWSLLGATQGGLALERLAAVLGREPMPVLEAAASRAVAGHVSVVVDESATATVCGIRDGVGPGEVWAAALRTVTDQIGEVGRSMTAVVGPQLRTVAAGGWSRSETLMHLERETFGQVERTDVDEPGARGAALLAGRAAGVASDPAEVFDRAIASPHR